LIPRQERFCQEYAADQHGGAADGRAGCRPRSNKLTEVKAARR
jgi:hypothetical protein